MGAVAVAAEGGGRRHAQHLHHAVDAPLAHQHLGVHRCLGVSSLRTRTRLYAGRLLEDLVLRDSAMLAATNFEVRCSSLAQKDDD